jgi:fructokinase
MIERAPEPGPIVLIGDALIDEVREDGRSRDLVGGAALNVAVGAALLGLDTTLIAMVGDDADGTAIRSVLAADGVRLLASPGDYGTSRAISDRTDGEPVYTFNRAAQRRRIRFGPRERYAIGNAALVVISCFPFDDQAQADELEHCLAGSDAAIVVDANPRSGMLTDRAAFARNLERTGAHCLLLKVSDDDARLLYGTPAGPLTERMLAAGTRAVLVTSGPQGAAVATRDGLTARVPIAALPGPVVDTMGAGDATLASVVHSLVSDGLPETVEGWTAALTRAMEVAAATCRQTGGRLRLPARPGAQP